MGRTLTFDEQWDVVAKGTTRPTMMISPETAEWIITNRNGCNRPRSGHNERAYAEAMRQGKWFDTGDVISVRASDGHVLNGQTRLRAIKLSGIPRVMHFAFGIVDEAFQVMDTHRKRSSADTFSVLGVANPSLIARIVRQVSFIKGREKAIRHRGVENQDVVAAYNLLDAERLQLARAFTVNISKTLVYDQAFLAGLYYCMRETHPLLVDDFFNRWATGAPARGGPPVVLHKKLAWRAVGTGHDASHDRMRIVIRAWNAFVTKTKITEEELLAIDGTDLPVVA